MGAGQPQAGDFSPLPEPARQRQGENAPIPILSFTTSPDSVNVSAAGQEVTATFRVVAVANGTVGTLWLTFDADGLPGGAAISNIYVTSQNRISGDDKDGTYQIRFTVPAGMPPGPLRPGIETYYYNSELDFSFGEAHGWADGND